MVKSYSTACPNDLVPLEVSAQPSQALSQIRRSNHGALAVKRTERGASRMIGRYPLPSPDEEGSDTLREGGKDNYERLVWVYFLPRSLHSMSQIA